MFSVQLVQSYQQISQVSEYRLSLIIFNKAAKLHTAHYNRAIMRINSYRTPQFMVSL